VTAEAPRRRPGGRSARVRASVLAALAQLVAELDPVEISLPLVAERAGVHPATLYRRWGTLAGLAEDAVTEALSRTSPLPDTGALESDLRAWATKAADDLAQPVAAGYLRLTLLAGGRHGRGAVTFVERSRQLQGMLDRAAARGEPAPTVEELVDVVLVPMYFHVLLTGASPGPEHALVLVDRLLRLRPALRAEGAEPAASSPGDP